MKVQRSVYVYSLVDENVAALRRYRRTGKIEVDTYHLENF